MQKSTVSLDFTCSQKWESMSPQEGGRFCHDCQKTVIDFSKVPPETLQKLFPVSGTEKQCGNFYAHQLDKPFGNWRDHIVSLYQKLIFASANKFYRQSTLLLMTTLLLITGCYRHVRGKVNPRSKKHQHQTSQNTFRVSKKNNT